MRIDDLAGKVIANRFALQEMIGKGGYGAVFEAEQLSVGRRCAVKILLPGCGDEDAMEERFRAEARATSRLTHPNSIVLFDFGVDPETGYLFLATEFLDGYTLYEIMAREKVVPVGRTIRILEQIAGSLDDAHRLGLVHRDIKPKNIMLITRAGQRDFVKVIDFGIAKTLGSGLGCDEGITKTGMMVGTPQYMAPEQLLGTHIDGTVDQYALAVVGYKMLTGRNPFHASTPMEMALRHINDRPLPLRSYRPELEVSPEFEDAFLRALSKVPEHRFESILLFVEEIKAAFGSPEAGVVDAGLFGQVDARTFQKKTLMLESLNLGDEEEARKPRPCSPEKIELDPEMVSDPSDEESLEEMNEDLAVTEVYQPVRIPETALISARENSPAEKGEAQSREDGRRTPVDLLGGQALESRRTRANTMEISSTELLDSSEKERPSRKREESTLTAHVQPYRIPRVAVVACSLAMLFSSAAILLFVFAKMEEVAATPEQSYISSEEVISNAIDEVEDRGEVEKQRFEELQRAVRQSVGEVDQVLSTASLAAFEALKAREKEVREEEERLAQERERQRASRPGRVTVTLIPWGTLHVNGRSIGDSTRQEVRLPPGRHQLALFQNGEQRASRTVDVSAGQSKIVILEARFD